MTQENARLRGELEAIKAEMRTFLQRLEAATDRLTYSGDPVVEDIGKALYDDASALRLIKEGRLYPCDRCGVLRTKAEGGTVFTVCDACWDALSAESPAAREAGRGDAEPPSQTGKSKSSDVVIP